MEDFRTRTQALLGQEAMEKLDRARVAVVGLGGVGGACAEALARAGVGNLLLMDHDQINATNINRQLFATVDTVGMLKTEAALARLLRINPQGRFTPLPVFYEAASREKLFSYGPEWVVDAVDTVTAKLDLAAACRERGVPLIQCLGTGNRLDPSAFRLGVIEDTAGCGCGLARVMRRELRRRGLAGQPVLYSVEPPVSAVLPGENGRHPPASISFCPPAAGYLLASWVVRQILL